METPIRPKSGSAGSTWIWKALWCLQIPGKVNIFIWRALHGIIPLKSVLANRHISQSGECPVCNLDAEDIMHLLFKCQTAAEMWEALGISQIIDEACTVDRSGSAVLELILVRQDNELPSIDAVGLKETIMVACWYLWWIRRPVGGRK